MEIVIALVIEKVALNKSSLLLKTISQNTKTLQLFTNIITTESIYKCKENAKLKDLFKEKPSGLNERGKKRKIFKRR